MIGDRIDGVNADNNEQLLSVLRHKFSDPIIPEGIIAFKTQKYTDERGFFQQDINSLMLKNLGFGSFFQKNLSKSAIGVIRGMHWQSKKSAQKKIITCFQGAVIDVVIDLRPDSETYGEINSFKLDSYEPNYLKIPAGFAHGFQSLEENTIFSYYVDAPYAPENEECINPLSEELEIYWENLPRIINQKDQSAISFKKYFSKPLKESDNE